MSRRHTPETRDWFCPSCKGKVFASKGVCRCGYKRGSGQSNKSKDWKCPGCNGLVYGSKDSTYQNHISVHSNRAILKECKCGTSKSGLTNRREASSNQRPGDWNCPGCNDLVFASKDKCRKCGTLKPSANNQLAPVAHEATNVVPNTTEVINNNYSGVVKPGDWRCLSCNENNFASRQNCFGCQLPKPGMDGQTNNTNI